MSFNDLFLRIYIPESIVKATNLFLDMNYNGELKIRYNIPWSGLNSHHDFKQSNVLAVSRLNRFRFCVMVFPAIEKSDSKGTQFRDVWMWYGARKYQ